jgi:hypothetical protein
MFVYLLSYTSQTSSCIGNPLTSAAVIFITFGIYKPKTPNCFVAFPGKVAQKGKNMILVQVCFSECGWTIHPCLYSTLQLEINTFQKEKAHWGILGIGTSVCRFRFFILFTNCCTQLGNGSVLLEAVADVPVILTCSCIRNLCYIRDFPQKNWMIDSFTILCYWNLRCFS